MKSIYIIISNSGSLVSKTLKYFTKEEYVHVTISIDKNLENAYSFGRKYTYIPLPGGLINEYYERRCKHFSKSKIKVYELDITNKQYNDLKDDLKNNYIKYKSKYKYNVLGLLYIKRKKVKHRKFHYCCSQFCGKILSENGILSFDKDYSLLEPKDFFNLDNVIYEGSTLDYLNKEKGF